MADFLPDAPSPKGPWPRRWHKYSNYRVVHQQQMVTLQNDGIVIHDGLSFVEAISKRVLIEVDLLGDVRTANGALVSVNKWLEVKYRQRVPFVRTREYSYHAHAHVGSDDVDLFRYDNCHGDPSTLHRHRFDVDGVDRGRVPVSPEALPPLAHIIREAEWFANHLRRE